MTRRLRGDLGQVAGVEAVPFGLLVLVVGLLLVAHTWAVVDAKFVAAVAAREATRAFVEVVLRAVGAQGRPTRGRTGRGPLGPFGARPPRRAHPAAPASGAASRSRFVGRLRVPSVGVPWRSARPSVAVRFRAQEVVDPYRDGLPGLATAGWPHDHRPGPRAAPCCSFPQPCWWSSSSPR